MLPYHGGKQKNGKKIANAIIGQIASEEFDGYVEPFVGMMGIGRHVINSVNARKYVFSDIHESLIELWKAVKDGNLPITHADQVHETMFVDLKNDPPSALKAYIGFTFTYGGQYFTTCSYNFTPRKHTTYLNSMEEYSKLLKDIPAEFHCCPYDEITNHLDPNGKYVFYLDPPYENTRCNYRTDQAYLKTFDHVAFHNWARNLVKQGHKVFITGVEPPEDAVIIVNGLHNVYTINTKTKAKRREDCLYTF